MDDRTHRGIRRDTLIVDVLTDILDVLAHVPESPRKRELRAQAMSYEQTVKRWTSVPPSDAQLEAMFELMTALHAKVLALTRQSGGASGNSSGSWRWQ